MIARQDIGPQAMLRDAPVSARPAVCWLGQAGFLIRAGDDRLAIDLYLSDVLADKHRGSRFPHVRMMPPPVTPEQLTGLDVVFCTHSHTDHMDPGTLGTLARLNPDCRFVVPRAAAAVAAERGVPPSRRVTAVAGRHGRLGRNVAWHALASAHEELKTDAAGDHLFLGYVLELDGLSVYHSGDCVPYPGLAEELRRHAIDVALLPVNGRDASRSAAGIPGNFTFDEAIRLCREAEISCMLTCHFGMFDFNTVDESQLDRQIAAIEEPPQCVRPCPGTACEWLPPCEPASIAASAKQPQPSRETTP